MLTITRIVPFRIQCENASRRDSLPIDSVGSDPGEVVSKALGLGSRLRRGRGSMGLNQVIEARLQNWSGVGTTSGLFLEADPPARIGRTA